MRWIFLLLSVFFIIILIGCGDDQDGTGELEPICFAEIEPPELMDIIPAEQLPANSSLILLIDSVAPDSLSVQVDNTNGTIQKHKDDSNLFLWTPNQEMPVGQAILYIQGKTEIKELPMCQPPSLSLSIDITVTEPDEPPPRLVESQPVDGAINVNPNKLREIVLEFNEPINVFHNITVVFEPSFGINAAGDSIQIQPHLSYTNPYNVSIIIDYWKKGISLARETNYTITLGNIIDLAGNSGSEKITFKTVDP